MKIFKKLSTKQKEIVGRLINGERILYNHWVSNICYRMEGEEKSLNWNTVRKLEELNLLRKIGDKNQFIKVIGFNWDLEVKSE